MPRVKTLTQVILLQMDIISKCFRLVADEALPAPWPRVTAKFAGPRYAARKTFRKNPAQVATFATKRTDLNPKQ
jgi:hypothetical protein